MAGFLGVSANKGCLGIGVVPLDSTDGAVKGVGSGPMRGVDVYGCKGQLQDE